jgi:hypothetical protein
MQYRYAVIDRLTSGLGDGAAYDDPRKIVSRHETAEAAERAAKRRGCGDRFAIIEIESPQTKAARALRAIPSERRTQASRANGAKGDPESHRRGGRPRKSP